MLKMIIYMSNFYKYTKYVLSVTEYFYNDIDKKSIVKTLIGK